MGSLTGRLGYAAGPTLLYVKGGYAYQDTTYGVRSVAGPAAFTLDGGKKNGYTIGGGLEYLVSPNWSTKLEYQYYSFGSTHLRSVTPAGVVRSRSFDNDVHTIKIGFNYRFN